MSASAARKARRHPTSQNIPQGDTVLVAYLHPNVVSHSFSDSLMRLVAHDLANEARVIRTGGPVMFRCGPGGLVEARNDIVKHFLDETDADWLWMVDSDMGFGADTVDRLVEAADPVERPVMGGLCFALKETRPDGFQGWHTSPAPTLYDWGKNANGESGFRVRDSYSVNTVTQVAGTGAACLLVHRSVMHRIREVNGDVWFVRTLYPNGAPVSEDLSFCYRVNQMGLPVHVHTGVRTTHHKQVWVGEMDYWTKTIAPPATEPTAVIVPAMRYSNAERFMQTLRASTGLATVYAIATDDEDEAFKAWSAAGAEAMAVSPGTTFAHRINAGYAATTEPWVFIVGDDVVFRPGWLDHAQAVAGDRFHVVGTNDLGNPRVLTGEHATHMLIRRSYIDEVGASWDGPKNVCHEGYSHWFVDDELVTAAKQRGVWTMALGSIVEHMHPAWGKAENDDVYELGQSHAPEDRKLFERRRRASRA